MQNLFMHVYRFSVYNQMHDVNIFLGKISYYEEGHGQGKRAKDLFSSNQSESKVLIACGKDWSKFYRKTT